VVFLSMTGTARIPTRPCPRPDVEASGAHESRVELPGEEQVVQRRRCGADEADILAEQHAHPAEEAR
jgi:hypothetical protein